jgi:hypothetical protein
VLIYNDKGNVFGAFSSKTKWQSNPTITWNTSPGAFLFLLMGNDTRAPLQLVLNNPHDPSTLCNCANFGPIMGAGNDLAILDKMEEGENQCNPITFGPKGGNIKFYFYLLFILL